MSKVFSLEERKDILARINNLISVKGYTLQEALKEVDISGTSYYKWSRSAKLAIVEEENNKIESNIPGKNDIQIYQLQNKIAELTTENGKLKDIIIKYILKDES